MSAADGVLLVIGSGMKQYREYLIASAAQRCQLWLFDAEEPTWQCRHLAGWSVVDVFDPAALVDAATELSRRIRVAGILCYHEGVILGAAQAAGALGLPTMSAAATQSCRDKYATRRLLTEAGLRQPRFALVFSPEEARAAAPRIGFPLVVKPRNLGASQGVVKVCDESALDLAFDASMSATQHGMTPYPGLLMEEYLEGPEISVDAAVFDNEYMPFVLARKRVGPEPYFEETGHTVTADDPLLADDEVIDTLAAAHVALGVRHGITHTELKLTPRGPVLVEVNGRLGGDLIPYLGWLATGIDPGYVAADLAIGIRPSLVTSRRRSAGIRFVYPPRDAVLHSATLPVPDRKDGLHEASLMVEPGTSLRLPPNGYVSRYAYVVATAESATACDERLDKAEAEVCAEWAPIPEPVPNAFVTR